MQKVQKSKKKMNSIFTNYFRRERKIQRRKLQEVLTSRYEHP